MNIRQILDSAVSRFEWYCDGDFRIISRSYVCATCLNVGKMRAELHHGGSRILDELSAFDLAEADPAAPYIGQINMVRASSFCGPKGAIWGLDCAKVQETMKYKLGHISVHDAGNLVEAAGALFGTTKARNFPLLPGSHVVCATRYIEKYGPSTVYCAVGIGVPTDRDRTNSAIVLMEDVGEIDWEDEKGSLKHTEIRQIENLLVKSIVQVGKNQGVRYEKAYVGVKSLKVEPGEIGCALVAVPYFALAKNAFPKDKSETLVRMSLDEWIKERTSRTGKQFHRVI